MPQYNYNPGEFFDNAPDGILLAENDIIQYMNSAAEDLLSGCGIQLASGDPLPQNFLSVDPSYPPPLRPVGNGALNVNVRPFPAGQQAAGLLITLGPVSSAGLPTTQLNQIIQHLRSPLSSSLLVTDLMDRQRTAPPLQINALRRSQYRLLRTVQILQTVVDLSEAQENFPFEPLDLAGLMRDLSMQVEGFLTSFPFSIQLDTPPSVLISGNEQLLRQMVLSLISNAIAGKADSLSITLKKKGGQAILTLKDNGQGMDQEALRCSYLPMVSENPLLSSLSTGLPLCRQIAALHKGSLLLKTGNSGTTCIISLPILQEKDTLASFTLHSPTPDLGCEDVFVELSEVLPDIFYSGQNLE